MTGSGDSGPGLLGLGDLIPKIFAQRVVIGLGVCKQLHQALLAAPDVELFVKSNYGNVEEVHQLVSKALSRFSETEAGVSVLQKDLASDPANPSQAYRTGDQVAIGLVEAISAQRFGSLARLALRMRSESVGLQLVDALNQCAKLHTLTLKDNSHVFKNIDVTTALAGSLHCLKSLTSLDLQDNRIGRQGANALAAGLMSCTLLSSLNLFHNDMQDEGLESLSQAMESCPALTALNLGWNSIREDGCYHIAHILTHCTRIQDLNICWNEIHDEGMSVVATGLRQILKLRNLNCLHTELGCDGVSMLSSALSNCEGVECLILGINSVSDSGAMSLARNLEIENQPGLLALQRLELHSNNIGSVGVGALVSGLSLHCTNLHFLGLADNEMGPAGVEWVANALGTLSTLGTLGIGRNQILPEGARLLAGALQSFPNMLSHLDLHRNQLGPHGAEWISGALPYCPALTQLNMRDNNIGSDGVQALSQVLSLCKCLRSLLLSENGIGDQGAEHLAEALPDIPTLKSLDLRYNSIGARGAGSLAKVLQFVPNLSYLNLENNGLVFGGGLELQESIQNPGLELHWS